MRVSGHLGVSCPLGSRRNGTEERTSSMTTDGDTGRIVAVDHVGYVVTDLASAVAFFIDVLGFEDISRRGHLGDTQSERMTGLFGVHPRAEADFVFLQLGTMKVELLQWTSPDQSAELPRNSDLGGRHIALAVQNLESVVARLASEPGVVVRDRNERGFYYASTPFGLELQLVPAP